MMPNLVVKGRRALRDRIRRLGFDVIRYPDADPAYRRLLLFRNRGVNLVLDVGANTGQYAQELRRHGYTGRLVSFEPLAQEYEKLERNATGDNLWSTSRIAIGSRQGVAKLNVAGNSMSSSLLPMLARHLESAPESGYLGTEEVSITTLDTVFSTYARHGDVIVLKIDVQGYERDVLDGAIDSLPRIAGIQLELSLVPLYEGGMLFEEARGRLIRAGYNLCAVEPGFSDPETGQLLQFDGIFFREMRVET